MITPGKFDTIDKIMRIIINCNIKNFSRLLTMKFFLLSLSPIFIISSSALAHQISAFNQDNVVEILASHFHSYFLLGGLTLALCRLTNLTAFVLFNLILVIFLSEHGQEIMASGEAIPIIIWLSGTIATAWVGYKASKSILDQFFEAIMSKLPGGEKDYANEK